MYYNNTFLSKHVYFTFSLSFFFVFCFFSPSLPFNTILELDASTGKYKHAPSAELWTAPSELRALAKLLGPFGLRKIEYEILACISKHAAALKVLLQRNEYPLRYLSAILSAGVSPSSSSSDYLQSINEDEISSANTNANANILNSRRYYSNSVDSNGHYTDFGSGLGQAGGGWR